MKKLLANLTFFSLILSHFLFAQEVSFSWVSNTGGGGSASAWVTAVDAAGSTITVGTFSGTIDMAPGPATYLFTASGSADIFIVKYSSAGDFIWARQVGNNQMEDSKAIAVDAAGNIFVAGSFSGVADFDPGPAAFNLTSPPGAFGAFLWKLDVNGNFVWAKSIAQTPDGSRGDAIATTPSGDIYVLGSFKGATDFDAGATGYTITSNSPMQDVFISKFDNGGGWLWTRAFFSSDGMLGYSIKSDALGNVYSTGTFNGTGDFDPGPGVYSLEANLEFLTQDIYITKLDADGNFGWAKQFTGEGTETAYGLALDMAGNIYLGCEFDGEVDFDPGPATFNLPGHYPWASSVVKLSNDGNFVWAKYFGDTGSAVQIKSLVVDLAGDIYFAGTFIGAIDFDPGPANFTLTTPDTYANIFIGKIKADGSFGFARSIGNNGFSVAYGITTDAGRNVFVTGYFMGMHDFDPDQGVHAVNAAMGISAYVLKLSRCQQSTAATIAASACGDYLLNSEVYTSSGVYTQYLTNAAGCDSILTLQLTISTPRTITASVTTCGAYSWEGNTYTGSGQYSVTYTGVNGCDSTLVLNLQVEAARRSTNHISICEGETYFAAGADQSLPGTYDDTLVSYLGCDSIVSTVLSIRPLPVMDLGVDRELCEGAALELSPGSFASYQWQDNSTSATFRAENAGLYWVKVTDAGQCSFTDSMTITGMLPKPAGFLAATDSICQYGEMEIKPNGNFQNYRWSTGSGYPSIRVAGPGQYTLEVQNADECYGSDTINIISKNCRTGVYFPNAFTPDGNGANDSFGATAYGSLIKFRLQVYNRWGELVFQSFEPSGRWNGMVKGAKASSGTFVWVCGYQLAGGSFMNERGVVTLIR